MPRPRPRRATAWALLGVLHAGRCADLQYPSPANPFAKPGTVVGGGGLLPGGEDRRREVRPAEGRSGALGTVRVLPHLGGTFFPMLQRKSGQKKRSGS